MTTRREIIKWLIAGVAVSATGGVVATRTEPVTQETWQQGLLRELGVSEYLGNMPNMRARDAVEAPTEATLRYFVEALPWEDVPGWDCDDYAMSTAALAARAGFTLGVVSNHSTEPKHAYNLAVTSEGGYFWIEPQTREMFRVGTASGNSWYQNYDIPPAGDENMIWF